MINKCKNNKDKALFYIKETIENNWSRAVLLNFIGTDLYERKGKATNNFDKNLPDVNSDLAKEMIRDPYCFDFISIREKYDEKELKDALMDNIQKFLLELGSGFSFVEREYRLQVGVTEYHMLSTYIRNAIDHPYDDNDDNIKQKEFEPYEVELSINLLIEIINYKKSDGAHK